ncbi:hypothetical protein FQN57_003632 [Myotisia sp. PD_48]|nr:hypothetical protein FQN57_003632 [Myotisia sp. PD_48]
MDRKPSNQDKRGTRWPTSFATLEAPESVMAKAKPTSSTRKLTKKSGSDQQQLLTGKEPLLHTKEDYLSMSSNMITYHEADPAHPSARKQGTPWIQY